MIRALSDRLRRFPPLGALAVMTLLCLGLRENFPFSHFPMYSSFGDYTYVIYVTDRNGAPIAMETITATRSGKLKKIYNDLASAARDRRREDDGSFKMTDMTEADLEPAGRYALEWFVENCKENGKAQLETLRPLSIHHLGLMMENGKFIRQDMLVATEESPSPSAQP